MLVGRFTYVQRDRGEYSVRVCHSEQAERGEESHVGSAKKMGPFAKAQGDRGQYGGGAAKSGKKFFPKK